ncbi:MAG: hypothetical protein PVH19_01220 [Planctomycetia bacterium]|jgi:hypothetical protein
MSEKKKSYPIGRIVMTAIAVVFIVFAVICFLAIRTVALEYREREKTRTIEGMDVDFSKPGEYTGTFHQTHPNTCGESNLFLEVPEGTFDDESAWAALRSFEFQCVVKNTDGQKVFDWTADLSYYTKEDFEKRPLKLFSFRGSGIPEGEHTITITVTKEVPLLAGVPQHLYAVYEVCGCEKGVVVLVFGSGLLVSSAIAGILLLIVVIVTIIKRKRKAGCHAHDSQGVGHV